MITVEEGAIGGFGEHVSRFLLNENLLGGGLKLKFSPMGLPDRCSPLPAPYLSWMALLDQKLHPAAVALGLNGRICISNRRCVGIRV